MPRIYSRPYVGRHLRVASAFAPDSWHVFRSKVIPIPQTHGDLYGYVVGPFRTMRGARYFAAHPIGTVAQAERAARRG